jgi:hypothetical protein
MTRQRNLGDEIAVVSEIDSQQRNRKESRAIGGCWWLNHSESGIENFVTVRIVSAFIQASKDAYAGIFNLVDIDCFLLCFSR